MSAKRNNELTVSVGMHVYMAMPARGSLALGHVCIIPVEHTPSFRAADDEVYEELKNFQKCLINMYKEEVGFACNSRAWIVIPGDCSTGACKVLDFYAGTVLHIF